MHLFSELRRREKEKNPIRAAVIGSGFFGSAVIRQLVRTPGITPAIIANRTPEKAAAALARTGVERDRILFCEDKKSARQAIEKGDYVVTSRLELPLELPEVEVVAETTGDPLVGCEIALAALRAGKHFVAANPETHATVGAILREEADRAGVVYSDMDGDQPGILKKLYDYVEGIGFKPVVAGNCKGVMKRYATPDTQADYCSKHPIKPWIATAAADGTKLNIEMCILANATGMRSPKLGMTGVETTLPTLLSDFEQKGLLERGPIVEYTLGIPVGVFVIGYHADPWVQEEMRYFKMGNGPHYLFFVPHVLCQYDAVPTIASAVIYREPAITPLKEKVMAEVLTFAKRDLETGQKLDGIGGFDCYGIIANHKTDRNDWLPIGLSGFARLKRPVRKDEPLRLSDVEMAESNVLIDLYYEQEAMLKKNRAGLFEAQLQKNQSGVATACF
jgi:predicted homoserine dehydrogenase-like protein